MPRLSDGNPRRHQNKLDIINNDFAEKTTRKTQKIENMQLSEKASQTSSPKGVPSQNSGTATEKFWENQTGNWRLSFLNSSNSCPTDIRKTTY